MLNTDKFVKELILYGYTHLCAVPCSFAKNLINSSINLSDKLEYLPCASEAVACSIAAGLKLSGKKPIVIVQSSGLTNMGSCMTSLLKPYGIHFPIIVSWRTYKEGDSEIQHQHLATRLPDLVGAYGYEYTILNKDEIATAVTQINECDTQKKICLLEEGTFSSTSLYPENQMDLSYYPERSKYLQVLESLYKETNELFIGTTGNTAREMHYFMPKTKNFYMAGNMGGALSLGLGAAKAGRSVTVCGGDAEFVMHLGGLTTAGRYKNLSLSYIVFDNKSNKSTGGQNSYQEHVDYLNIARASGIASTFEVDSVDAFEACVSKIRDIKEISVIQAKCSFDPMAPRPDKQAIRDSKAIFL